ncbi:MAG: hypothetical protein ACD_79C01130G0003 [uncultured bacterium]|nr:MAG: hypothetical protein ACD_79C01130G0003 [uncultured bacterium]
MIESKLSEYFGYNSFKKGQKEVIQKIMQNESVAAIFPTGAGKSICYQLPALLLPGLTLVVSPLLSLMKDQIDFLSLHKIPAARLDSTLSKNEYNDIIEKAEKGTLKILMISVERFRNERFRYHLKKMNVSLLVIDEAHCISEWGHNFRPEYLKIPAYQNEFNIKQVLLLTATATKKVSNDFCAKFKIRKENIIVTGFYRNNLFLQITPLEEVQKNNQLIKRINESPGVSTIIYVTLQKTAEEVAGFLMKNKIKVAFYHAGMENEERELIQNRFMAGELDCVVATIAFGMGIDKKDIRRIIHYDLPKSLENYSQEIGRSGRDGKASFCEVLANRDNITILENFIYGDTPDIQSIKIVLEQIRNNKGFVWEIKTGKLSVDTNIRILPLKTLLVYLDMEGIIRPKYTYYEEYSFKYKITPQEIIDNFKNERKTFVKNILDNSLTKKTWTYVDMQEIVASYKSDRTRIIAALEYFEEKEWIELSSNLSIEVFDILNQAFDISEISNKMFELFKNKETNEIERIHNMVSFFETSRCISKNLAEYFGEIISADFCGHCSFCKSGTVSINGISTLKPLALIELNKLIDEFKKASGEYFSLSNLAKFLCGINTPHFSRIKAKSMTGFGMLERYSFISVIKKIESLLYSHNSE